MSWDKLNYDLQIKVLNKINDLIAEETDPKLLKALIEASNELKLWMVNPANIEPYIVEAQEVDELSVTPKSFLFLSMLFGSE